MADWNPVDISNLNAPEILAIALAALAILVPVILFWKIVIGRRK